MNVRLAVIGLLVCLGLGAYTTHKLYKMASIRGYAGSLEIERQIVTDKRAEEVRGRRGSTRVCWLHWEPGRVQADCDSWEAVRIGDTIELVAYGDKRYLRHGGLYTSDGNFVFDLVLLAAELGGLVVCVVLLRRARASRRRQLAK